MLRKVIEALAAALSFVVNLRSDSDTLRRQNAELEKALAEATARNAQLITDLKAEDLDDEAREKVLADALDEANAAQAALDKLKADSAELLAEIEEANGKADALIAEITADPRIPISVNEGAVDQGDAPLPGSHNAVLELSTLGTEQLDIALRYTGTDPAMVATLRAIAQNAIQIGKDQPPSGENVLTRVSLTVDGALAQDHGFHSLGQTIAVQLAAVRDLNVVVEADAKENGVVIDAEPANAA